VAQETQNVTIKGVSARPASPCRGTSPAASTRRRWQRSKKAITDWAGYYLPPSSVFTGDNQLLYHGLTDSEEQPDLRRRSGLPHAAGEAYKGRSRRGKLDATKSPLAVPDQLP